MMLQRYIGQTQSAGFEIGVRRSFPTSPERAWQLVTSRAGSQLWLGNKETLNWQKDEHFQTRDGAQGVIRVVNPGVNLRLTWQPANWSKASLIQVRVILKDANTVISFHQEHLAGPKEREQMRQHWAQVLDALQDLLSTIKH